jgi:hypothetical protein
MLLGCDLIHEPADFFTLGNEGPELNEPFTAGYVSGELYELGSSRGCDYDSDPEGNDTEYSTE